MTHHRNSLVLFVCFAVSSAVAGKPSGPPGRVESQCCSDSRQIADVFTAPGQLYGPRDSSIHQHPAAYHFETIHVASQPVASNEKPAFNFRLGFDFCMDGKPVGFVSVSQNSYFTFDDKSVEESADLSASNPSTPTLFIGGGDTVATFIGRRDVVENDLPAVVIRFEGTLLGSSLGSMSPEIIWEATFFPQNTVRVSSGIDVRDPKSSEFFSGLSNGCGAWKVEGLWAPEPAWLFSNNIGCPTECTPDAIPLAPERRASPVVIPVPEPVESCGGGCAPAVAVPVNPISYGGSNGMDSTWTSLMGRNSNAAVKIDDMGFDFCIAGQSVRHSTFISAGSHFTFGGNAQTRSPSASSPPRPTLFVGGGDTVALGIGKKDIEENGLAGVVIRFEGRSAESESPTNIVWETTFYEDNTIRVVSISDDRLRPVFSGLSDGKGTWIVEDAPFGAGKAWKYSQTISRAVESAPDALTSAPIRAECPVLPSWLLEGADLYPSCDIGMDWADIIRIVTETDSAYIETGGLGLLTEDDVVEAWVCVKDDPCGLRALEDWFCYVYVEDSGPFVPWGPRGCIDALR
eukprot:CAMPEP_0181295082 /NCGR_PEP_ID=MMETSP1101-20121128/3948_1 /TAXON_ID=46948 /ORGANISM="Rhodomonas abbreviata, Strain Caron Lab Isolate" /LENGTH=572 /DNA_ID=CAMNT_0023399791 /DNA_START=165 /DNA_END=1883 /DNA_ORIENTATION=-